MTNNYEQIDHLISLIEMFQAEVKDCNSKIAKAHEQLEYNGNHPNTIAYIMLTILCEKRDKAIYGLIQAKRWLDKLTA